MVIIVLCHRLGQPICGFFRRLQRRPNPRAGEQLEDLCLPGCELSSFVLGQGQQEFFRLVHRDPDIRQGPESGPERLEVPSDLFHLHLYGRDVESG